MPRRHDHFGIDTALGRAGDIQKKKLQLQGTYGQLARRRLWEIMGHHVGNLVWIKTRYLVPAYLVGSTYLGVGVPVGVRSASF